MAEEESAPAQDQRKIEFEIYQSLRNYEERYNQSQAEIKKIASGWMLLTFGALAFIVRGELAPEKSLIDSAPLVVAVALGGNVGLLTLWMIDQRVYQRLLNAVFSVGLRLERKNPQWPPIRSLMWVNSGSRGMARYHSLFYAVPMLLHNVAALYAARVMAEVSHPLMIAGTAAGFVLMAVVLGEWFAGGLEKGLRDKSRLIERTAKPWRD